MMRRSNDLPATSRVFTGILGAALACAASRGAVASAATPAQHATPTPRGKEAAIDQYFGPMKMSALGIREKVDALGRRYHARTITDEDLVHDAKLAEASFDAWRAAYPHDTWIVPTAYHLEQLYQAVQTPEARAHATSLLHLIAGDYPKSKDAHLARLRLAQGFPPFHAESATHATPNPYAHEAAGGSSPDLPAPAMPSGAPSAAASPEASPAAPDAASPAPSATPV